MQVKVRVRVNDIPEKDTINGEFLYFDNCTEVRTNKAIPFGHDHEGQPSKEYIDASLENKKSQGVKNPTTGRNFDNLHFMLRHRPTTAKRIKSEPEQGKTPYHLNTLDWKDRVTGEWHRLIYDTVVFLCNDKGDTLQKIDG